VAVCFVKNSTGSWTAYGRNGTPSTLVGSAAGGSVLGTASFDSSSNLTGTSKFNFTIPDAEVAGGTATQALTIDFAGTTQFGATSGGLSNFQDGYSAASLTGFTDGTLTGNYSNGRGSLAARSWLHVKCFLI